MRDDRDYFGYDVRFCGDCRHYEPLYIYSNPRPGVIGKTKRDKGECTRYGITVHDRTIDEEGCWEE